MQPHRLDESILIACPDARPPAYQAVVGLSRAKLLRTFVTSCYYNPEGRLPNLLRRVAPERFARLERVLLRRHNSEIPQARVRPISSVDMALRLEGRLAGKWPRLKRALTRWRTESFDAIVARSIAEDPPKGVVVFSDVGSERTLPTCRRLGIRTIVSMVHGDVREEQLVLEAEAAAAPDFLPIYLGDGALDPVDLKWLHERRLQDLALADCVIVPSDHIASTLVRCGTSRDKLRVIPYAADCRRFHPLARGDHEPACTFLFAGGITQRKGIKYLLEAWSRIRRPGWKLQLLGPLPRDRGPLEPFLGMVESLGRVSHGEMPALMAAADVFVFPSLFEGSAVVTYEALACGLPSVVTPNAGSVVRDGIEGFVVSPRDVDALAARMERLGNDRELRTRMAGAARARALTYNWPRYHADLVAVVEHLISRDAEFSHCRPGRKTG
jgi:alpha-maltose-1-phosphate synthase